jgi:hypothetical protein
MDLEINLPKWSFRKSMTIVHFHSIHFAFRHNSLYTKARNGVKRLAYIDVINGVV